MLRLRKATLRQTDDRKIKEKCPAPGGIQTHNQNALTAAHIQVKNRHFKTCLKV